MKPPETKNSTKYRIDPKPIKLLKVFAPKLILEGLIKLKKNTQSQKLGQKKKWKA